MLHRKDTTTKGTPYGPGSIYISHSMIMASVVGTCLMVREGIPEIGPWDPLGRIQVQLGD